MDIAALLVEVFDRIPPLANDAVHGVDAEGLIFRPGPRANTIAWLIWHSARIVDAQMADVAGTDQLWLSGEWARRLGLEADPRNHGYGHSADQVMTIRPARAEDVTDYLDAVIATSRTILHGLTDADLDRIVDRQYDPPVTLGVRLVSIVDDCIQHLGQAAYVRGLLP